MPFAGAGFLGGNGVKRVKTGVRDGASLIERKFDRRDLPETKFFLETAGD